MIQLKNGCAYSGLSVTFTSLFLTEYEERISLNLSLFLQDYKSSDKPSKFEILKSRLIERKITSIRENILSTYPYI